MDVERGKGKVKDQMVMRKRLILRGRTKRFD